MQLLETAVMRGPNYWSVTHPKLIVMTITWMPGHAASALAIKHHLSTLFGPSPDWEAEEAVLRSMDEGLHMGYLVAAVAIHLQRCAAIDCRYKTAEMSAKDDRAQAVFEYIEERVGLLVAESAVKLTGALISDQPCNVQDEVKKIVAKWDAVDPGKLTSCIVDEAVKRNIPCIYLNSHRLIQLGHGAHQKRIQKSATDGTASIGVKIAGSKQLTKKLLGESGVPVPKGRLIRNKGDLAKAIKAIGYPVALKPQAGNHGKGIGLNIGNYEEAVAAFRTARKVSGSSGVIVEKFITGSDYRLLTINYTLVAAAKRTPAMVTGDGSSTIRALIDRVNSDPKRGPGHTRQLTFINADAATEQFLRRSGLTLDSVPAANQPVFVKSVANLSAGGTATDVTDLVHPENVFLAERIAKIVGLDICGIDIITPDIGVPLRLNGGTVLEVNSVPGYRSHMEPSEGTPRNVAGSTIDMLFPEGAPFDIPIIAVTGTENHPFSGSVIEAMMTGIGYKVGAATSVGISIQQVPITEGDCRFYEHAQLVLRDPTIDCALVECATSGIFQTGLAFQSCAVALVLDPVPDRSSIGAAAVVARCVSKTGYALLNADNPSLRQLCAGLDCHTAFFSRDANNPLITEHLKAGGVAAVLENGEVVVYTGSEKMTIVHLNETTSEQLASALLGVLYKVPIPMIRNALFNPPAGR